MPILDRKFLTHKRHYIFQSLLAGVFSYLILLALSGHEHTDILGVIGFTSLGSSTFTVFATPDAPTASTRRLLGGYIASIIIGMICWEIAHLLLNKFALMQHEAVYGIFAAIALMVTTFFTAVFDIEHPPSAGLALGMVLEEWNTQTLLTIILILFILALLRRLLGRWLINLM